MDEAELIEALNAIDNEWREHFDSILEAAEYHRLLNTADNDIYDELMFDD